MQKARSKKSDLQFLILNNKNERVLKDILHRKQEKEDFLSRQSNELIEELEMKHKSSHKLMRM